MQFGEKTGWYFNKEGGARVVKAPKPRTKQEQRNKTSKNPAPLTNRNRKFWAGRKRKKRQPSQDEQEILMSEDYAALAAEYRAETDPRRRRSLAEQAAFQFDEDWDDYEEPDWRGQEHPADADMTHLRPAANPAKFKQVQPQRFPALWMGDPSELAAKMHDMAESLEQGGEEDPTDVMWHIKRAQDLLGDERMNHHTHESKYPEVSDEIMAAAHRLADAFNRRRSQQMSEVTRAVRKAYQFSSDEEAAGFLRDMAPKVLQFYGVNSKYNARPTGGGGYGGRKPGVGGGRELPTQGNDLYHWHQSHPGADETSGPDTPPPASFVKILGKVLGSPLAALQFLAQWKANRQEEEDVGYVKTTSPLGINVRSELGADDFKINKIPRPSEQRLPPQRRQRYAGPQMPQQVPQMAEAPDVYQGRLVAQFPSVYQPIQFGEKPPGLAHSEKQGRSCAACKHFTAGKNKDTDGQGRCKLFDFIVKSYQVCDTYTPTDKERDFRGPGIMLDREGKDDPHGGSSQMSEDEKDAAYFAGYAKSLVDRFPERFK